jgi:hypothetical protein
MTPASLQQLQRCDCRTRQGRERAVQLLPEALQQARSYAHVQAAARAAASQFDDENDSVRPGLPEAIALYGGAPAGSWTRKERGITLPGLLSRWLLCCRARRGADRRRVRRGLVPCWQGDAGAAAPGRKLGQGACARARLGLLLAAAKRARCAEATAHRGRRPRWPAAAGAGAAQHG